MIVVKNSDIIKTLLFIYFVTSVLLLTAAEGLGKILLGITSFVAVMLLLNMTLSENKLKIVIPFTFAFLFFSFVPIIINGRTLQLNLFLSFYSSFILSCILLFDINGKHYVGYLYKLFYCLVIILFFILLSGFDPNNIFAGSRNTISLLLVSIGSVFLLDKRMQIKKRPAIFLYFIIFITSVMAQGRSGIITALLLLIASVFYFYKELRTSSIIYLLLFLVFLSIFLTVYFESIFDISYFDYLRKKGLDDSARSSILNEYFSSLTVSNIFTGVDTSNMSIISSYNNNPHNTYIYLHISFGFLALCIFFIVFLYLIMTLVLLDLISFLTVSAVLIRIGTDSASGIMLVPISFVFFLFFYRIKFLQK